MGQTVGSPPPPLGTWQRLRLFSRRWPAQLHHAHTAALYLLPLELVTGVLLYLPIFHSALIRWLPIIEAVHIWGGIVFCALLALPILFPLGRRLLAVADWRALFWLGAGLAVSGLALWAPGIGVLLQGGASTVHGLLALAIGLWAIYHGVVRLETAARGGDPGRKRNERRPLSRRNLLGEFSRAILWTTLGTATVGWLQGLRRTLWADAATPAPTGTPRTPPDSPIPGFVLYTVTGAYPQYSPTDWHLEVKGLVQVPLSLTLDDIRALPQVTEVRTFRCVTGWSVPNVTWEGVLISDLLAKAIPHQSATWITFRSFDGVYTDSLSLSQAQTTGVMLAHRADGRPLATQQGAPLRLLVPDMFGYKSVKWLQSLKLTNEELMGYWELRGYGPNAYLNTVDGWPPGEGGLAGLWP